MRHRIASTVGNGSRVASARMKRTPVGIAESLPVTRYDRTMSTPTYPTSPRSTSCIHVSFFLMHVEERAHASSRAPRAARRAAPTLQAAGRDGHTPPPQRSSAQIWRSRWRRPSGANTRGWRDGEAPAGRAALRERACAASRRPAPAASSSSEHPGGAPLASLGDGLGEQRRSRWRARACRTVARRPARRRCRLHATPRAFSGPITKSAPWPCHEARQR